MVTGNVGTSVPVVVTWKLASFIQLLSTDNIAISARSDVQPFLLLIIAWPIECVHVYNVYY